MTDVLKALNGLVRPVDDMLSADEWRLRAMQAEAKLLRLAARSVNTQNETRKLRRNYRRQRPTYDQIAHRALSDCQLMYALFLGGHDTTRQRCLDELGISKRRWNWARALAQLSGIHNGVEFVDHLPMPEIIRRLREGVDAAEQNPVLLRGYMPRNGGPRRTAGR